MSAKDLLRARVSTFNQQDIGIVGGVTINRTVEEVARLEDMAIKYVAAQALIDGVATTPQGLAVRQILPDKDLRDGRSSSNNAISRRDWVQPTSGNWAAADVNADTQVYKTTRDVDNDRKTYAYFGLRAVNIGPADTTSTTGINSVVWKRSNGVKTVDIWQVEEIDPNPARAVFARTPILYKKGDDQRIDMVPSARGSNLNENLAFLGFVAEPINHNISG